MTDTGGETHGLALMSSAYMFTLASVFLPDLHKQASSLRSPLALELLTWLCFFWLYHCGNIEQFLFLFCWGFLFCFLNSESWIEAKYKFSKFLSLMEMFDLSPHDTFLQHSCTECSGSAVPGDESLFYHRQDNF